MKGGVVSEDKTLRLTQGLGFAGDRRASTSQTVLLSQQSVASDSQWALVPTKERPEGLSAAAAAALPSHGWQRAAEATEPAAEAGRARRLFPRLWCPGLRGFSSAGAPGSFRH